MSSRWQTLEIAVSPEGFATLALNRPDARNTLTIALRKELHQAVATLAADPQVRVLILTARGEIFSAGLDLAEWGEGTAASAYDHDAVAAISQFKGPIIGAINGAAVTGGLELALACDLLIAADSARFADTHVRVGLLPGWGGSVRLAKRVGLARAMDMALTARFVDAAEALSWGLVNQVVAPFELSAAAEALARQLLAAVPAGLAAYRRLLWEQADMPLADAIAHERAASIAMNRGVTQEELLRRLAALKRRG
ncbi:enoyl-CoA hydratase-related protein [Ferrovibrio sp.]|uniref:enoyl-CoA hydratase-related protein n=1 Tax=Ferrovibrio sp. TaxID=1917215 RepID=UPI003D1031A1